MLAAQEVATRRLTLFARADGKACAELQRATAAKVDFCAGWGVILLAWLALSASVDRMTSEMSAKIAANRDRLAAD